MGTAYVVEQRLDRALVTREWLTLFPNVQLLNLVSPKSDHSPLLLTRVPSVEGTRDRRFKFESVCLSIPELPHVDREGWCKITDANVMTKLNSCASVLGPCG